MLDSLRLLLMPPGAGSVRPSCGGLPRAGITNVPSTRQGPELALAVSPHRSPSSLRGGDKLAELGQIPSLPPSPQPWPQPRLPSSPEPLQPTLPAWGAL